MSNYSQPLYKHLATTIDARINCERMNNQEWLIEHKFDIINFAKNFLPSGSGIDSGCQIDLDKSTGEKIVINTSYHHMNENGYYNGWTDHTIIVKSSLIHTLDITITGRNRNDIKDYLYDIFRQALMDMIDYDQEKQCYFSPAMRDAARQFQERVKQGIEV